MFDVETVALAVSFEIENERETSDFLFTVWFENCAAFWEEAFEAFAMVNLTQKKMNRRLEA